MRYSEDIIKLNENLVRKVCLFPDCGKIFYCKSRYASQTKYCSNGCLQASYYQRRKEAELNQLDNFSASEVENNNPKNQINMDTTELLMKAKDDLAETRTKLILAERDLKDFELLKDQLSDTKSQLSVVNAQLNGSKRELTFTNSQISEIKVEITTAKSELSKVKGQLNVANDKIEELQERLEELDEENSGLTNENDDLSDQVMNLTEERGELILATLVMQARGIPNVDGYKIEFETITRYLPDFEYKQDQDFSLPLWNWLLAHKKNENFLVISSYKT
jgi:hypothetical protein